MSRRRLAIAALFAVALAAAGAVLHLRTVSGHHLVVRHVEPDAKSAQKLVGASSFMQAGTESAPPSVRAAEEAYFQRAFPADEVAFPLQQDAQVAWAHAKGRGHGYGKLKKSPGVWTLAGPSVATQPQILNFSGQQYVTSGRVTALAIDPNCNASACRLWLGAAGGGIWRTDQALSSNPTWTFVSGSLPSNAIGTLTYDAGTNTLYAGTGEPNAAVDNEAGMGLFKSTDGGDTWTHLPAVTTTTISGNYTGDAFLNRSINSIVVDPTNSHVLYVGSMSGLRGISSVIQGGVGGNPTPLPGRGVYKSTDGGQTFTYLNSATGLPFPLRGVTNVVLDPSDHNIVYAGQFGQGVYRSLDGGATWAQIFAPINPANPAAIERDSIAVNTLPNGKTRMYIGAGDNGTFLSRLYRSDDARAATPIFTDITTPQDSGYCGAINAAQCWYDNVVYSPPGDPDTVYLGGNYDYNNAGVPVLGGDAGARTNGRAFLVSHDGGLNFNDLTRDAGPEGQENGMHPDQHAIAISPTDPNIVFFGSDGGIMRSSGHFADISSQCDTRGLSAANLAICKQLLSRVPTQLNSLNVGLPTLQFQSFSLNPADPTNLQGGTQDNGTWLGTAGNQTWTQTIWGDGGQSGFSASDPNLRVNTFTGQANDANFRGGDPAKWVVITGPIAGSPEGSWFYPPMIADPNPHAGQTIFQGSQSIWRSQDWGGNQAFLEANCSEFTTASTDPKCGDFVRIGPAGATDLTGAAYGADRGGGFVSAIARAPSDTGTLWASAGQAGRVFISKNADAPAASVTYTRIDTASTPNRFVSGIFVDPKDPNHAWISYSGFNANTPATPGHVFSVVYDPHTQTATWTSLDGSGATAFPDIPATDVVVDSKGNVYVSNDFGVMLLPKGSTNWQVAGDGLPKVEVAGLTIAPNAGKLYAATHGLSAWQLTLP